VLLIVYVLSYFEPLDGNMFLMSLTLTALVFINIGWMKSNVTHTSKVRGVIETLGLGVIAAALAYLAGDLLEHWLA
jgi:VIT1/CCC1 family predicted Fe2+/Mn2+ transporter